MFGWCQVPSLLLISVVSSPQICVSSECEHSGFIRVASGKKRGFVPCDILEMIWNTQRHETREGRISRPAVRGRGSLQGPSGGIHLREEMWCWFLPARTLLLLLLFCRRETLRWLDWLFVAERGDLTWFDLIRRADVCVFIPSLFFFPLWAVYFLSKSENCLSV